MKTGTKIALWLTGIAVVGVGSYFIYKSVKKSRDEKKLGALNVPTQTTVKDSLSKSLSQLIPNTQPKGFGAQAGGISNPNLVDRNKYKEVFKPFNPNLPNKI